MLSEQHKKVHDILLHLYKKSRVVKCVETESKMVVQGPRGGGEWGGLLVTGCRVLIWGNETEERFCRWVVGRSNVPYSINVLKVPEPHT